MRRPKSQFSARYRVARECESNTSGVPVRRLNCKSDYSRFRWFWSAMSLFAIEMNVPALCPAVCVQLSIAVFPVRKCPASR